MYYNRKTYIKQIHNALQQQNIHKANKHALQQKNIYKTNTHAL